MVLALKISNFPLTNSSNSLSFSFGSETTRLMNFSTWTSLLIVCLLVLKVYVHLSIKDFNPLDSVLLADEEEVEEEAECGGVGNLTMTSIFFTGVGGMIFESAELVGNAVVCVTTFLVIGFLLKDMNNGDSSLCSMALAMACDSLRLEFLGLRNSFGSLLECCIGMLGKTLSFTEFIITEFLYCGLWSGSWTALLLWSLYVFCRLSMIL
ncbi:hypothetical protein WICPIJ_007471 [Wickerhamomyces pijperi]|uniref:Transmembrane protein n=1 Tax=Wickerhamomyces pijperi TaxID=599730 RepID=A0A9P8Q1U1_WICPI|nr:hypothetical protein WICPIJ_007471 [Wickerhamomyces pijperi]